MRKYRLIAVIVVIFSLILTGCSPAGASISEGEAFDPLAVDYSKVPLATLEMEDGGIIKIALFPDLAENTVNNFISLSNEGFYDGLTFHRVIENFMIQGGDPLGNGMGNPGYSIQGEFSSNNFENNLKHNRGVVSMARSRDMDSAGSQFFIMHADYNSLDGDYAGFGYVIEGMDVVDKIAGVDTGKADKPKEDVIIKSISIELNGYEPLEVIKIED